MVKRIKILFTIPNFDTAGSGKVVYDLVRGLDKTVFEAEICCFHDQGAFFKTIKQLGVKIHLFQFATSYRPFITFPIRVFKIYKFFKRHQFDMIHSWHWSSDISEPLAAKLARIPFVYTKKAMGWGNRSWLWRSKLSSHIIAINSDMMHEFFAKMNHKVTQMSLGVDTSYFKPLSKTWITPDGLSFKKTDFIIASVANLVPVKGIEVLLKAVQQLDDNNIKVLVVGKDDNEYGEELKNEFRSPCVFFLGKQLNVRPYLALADLFVIPTKDKGRKEGMPIAPLEAMASQRIVLGSNISGIKDILKAFPECLFKAGNIEDLKNKLNYIINLNEIKKKNIRIKMSQHIEANYTVSHFISQHEELYKNLKR